METFKHHRYQLDVSWHELENLQWGLRCMLCEGAGDEDDINALLAKIKSLALEHRRAFIEECGFKINDEAQSLTHETFIDHRTGKLFTDPMTYLHNKGCFDEVLHDHFEWIVYYFKDAL